MILAGVLLTNSTRCEPITPPTVAVIVLTPAVGEVIVALTSPAASVVPAEGLIVPRVANSCIACPDCGRPLSR